MKVTFDISNERFAFYTEDEWSNQVEQWRDELRNELKGVNVVTLAEEDLVEYMRGNELFFDSFEVYFEV